MQVVASAETLWIVNNSNLDVQERVIVRSMYVGPTSCVGGRMVGSVFDRSPN